MAAVETLLFVLELRQVFESQERYQNQVRGEMEVLVVSGAVL